MKATALLIALALSGCATMPGSPTGPTGPTAALGQVATVGGLSIRPLAIVEDSRCPSNVQCVWAGRLVVDAEIDFHGGSEQLRGRLTLGQPLQLGPQAVTLVAAAPEKVAGVATDPRAYRFTFAVDPQP